MSQLEEETSATKREHVHTQKASENFEHDYKMKLNRLDKIWEGVEDIIVKKAECQDISELKNLEKELVSLQTKLDEKAEEIKGFLVRANTSRSKTILEEHESFCERAKRIFQNTFHSMKGLKLELLEELSSHGTSESSTLRMKRVAKASAERSKLAYVKKEADLLKRKLSLEADIKILKQESKAAAAEAEVEAIENLDLQERGLSPVSFDRAERTHAYVTEFTLGQGQGRALDVQTLRTPSPPRPPDTCARPTPKISASNFGMLNPLAQPFEPPSQAESGMTPAMSDFMQYLLKKDMLLSRFSNFNDRPESYASWKASFRSIIGQLKLSSFEEMDLLVKWLGPESSLYASSIKAANIADPERGLARTWERLEDRYGRPEMVESALKAKINNFPKLTNKDNKLLYKLSDILSEIESCKENPKYATLLSYFDSSSGVKPIVNKLSHSLQEKWTNQAAKYKERHNVSFPPFTFFVNFIRDMSSLKNDPAFMYDSQVVPKSNFENAKPRGNEVCSKKTEIDMHLKPAEKVGNKVLKRCPIHKAEHSLNECRAFIAKSYEERKKFLKDNHICFRCCVANDHIARNCKVNITCKHCKNENHATAMHRDFVPPRNMNGGEKGNLTPENVDGGEQTCVKESVASKCTTLCGEGFTGRSCGKTLLVNVRLSGEPENTVKVYAVIDDQSNRSLISKELLDSLGTHVCSESAPYMLSSCSGSVAMYGRRAQDIFVSSLSGAHSFKLPVLIECEAIPNNLSEVPTPDIARNYPHLNHIAENIPPLEPNVGVHLLIGRDIPEIHHVLNQFTGPKGTPFAQELKLGWAIIGEVCLGGVHPPDTVIANKTNILSDGRTTIFEPCQNTLSVKDNFLVQSINCQPRHNYTGESVFHKSPQDDKIGLSSEDRKFLQLMDRELQKDEEGRWTAPLPFRTPKQPLPNNRPIAWKRALLLDNTLRKDPVKKQHFVTFMSKVLDSGAAEVAPPIDSNETKCWYLPLFGVYHPRKPDQIRGVFDSSSVFQGTSLNSILMSGPDLSNSLLGVLLRFRSDSVAATVDIEQMFYQFYVNKEHRDYLRFFWYKDNNPNNNLIEYRMRVHVFGNSPSPAIATYGLRKAVSDPQTCCEVKDFVTKNFYVDDGLISLPTSSEVIDVLSKTQKVLKDEGNIRLHKIVSNNPTVMKAFNVEDLGKDLKSISLGEEALPIQRSLGISWDLNSDNFIFNVELDHKPYTKRGMLSTINGLFDPLGFLAPITLRGKIILREVAPSGTDWDEPLSDHHRAEWESWRSSLQSLRDIEIPRMFIPTSLSTSKNVEVFIFSDASEKAIAAVSYMKVSDSEGSHVGFVIGKSKLAPLKGHTIPRLELCGAVLATELGQTISEQLHIDGKAIKYFTDSRVVLGYICNETRRFFNYVSNRVEQIHKVSMPSQWNFIPSELNPADCGTRTTTSISEMKDSSWLHGPKWLHKHETLQQFHDKFQLVSPQEDKEVRPDVMVQKTEIVSINTLSTQRFEKFSCWRRLTRAVSFLLHIARSFKKPDGACAGWHKCLKPMTAELCSDAETCIIKAVQKESFPDEIHCLSKGRQLPRNSNILALSPFLDTNGILRVGGRLSKLKGHLPTGQVNPVIMPKNHHVSILLIRHFHENIKHQGRHLTEGAVRTGGYWIIGAKKTISSLIYKCVLCRKLRRDLEQQKMSDLPIDRLTPGPPFSSVGVDMFGPWEVVTRRTRGGSAANKRWAILFTCLVTRAVHIELVQDMSSSSFINALRRFIALRGPVKLFRSDRGTNFIGATDDMKVNTVNVEDDSVRKFLCDSGCTWIFNVPHSSHMGGAWERIIGMVRRILSAVFLKTKSLTHEILSTFMAEVCAILNSRPIAPISSDPESPMILTPFMLLTGKTDFLPVISQSLDLKDIYKAEWKHVQVLSDLFWKLWKTDYIQSLQSRRKWLSDRPNLKVGDVVLLKDKDCHRYNWPTGIVDKVYESDDEKVRKVSVRTIKDGKSVTYMRPISDLVLLLE